MSGAIVVGAGPGIGLSVARRFAVEGVPVGLIARSDATLSSASAALSDTGAETARAPADVRNEIALRTALDAIAGRL